VFGEVDIVSLRNQADPELVAMMDLTGISSIYRPLQAVPPFSGWDNEFVIGYVLKGIQAVLPYRGCDGFAEARPTSAF
jgi:hypothetical protein